MIKMSETELNDKIIASMNSGNLTNNEMIIIAALQEIRENIVLIKSKLGI